MSEYQELLAAEAARLVTPETPLATAPKLAFSDSQSHLEGYIDVDFDVIMEAVEAEGYDPQNYSAMAVQIASKKDLRSHGGDAVWKAPQVFDDEVRYPVIRMATPGWWLNTERWLNGQLRHELRHTMQETLEPPFYHRRLPQAAVVAGGAALCAWGVINGSTDLFEPASFESDVNVFIDYVTTLVGGVALHEPSFPLWCVNRNEWDAVRYQYSRKWSALTITE